MFEEYQVTTERIQNILKDKQYRKFLEKNKKAEKKRKFCHHDMTHFLDVARIAMILSLKQKLEIEAEMIYATALLHDIGRFEQYKTGMGHEEASAILAPAILERAGFTQQEVAEITDAIRSHRNALIKDDASLSGVIYRADKLSRPCFACEAEDRCNWKGEKKNQTLKV